MTEGSNRQHVLDFLNVLYSGDALERCTDDIEFLANAPIEILPHMGHRRGKAELREMWDAVRARYSELRCEVPMLVTEDDKAAAFGPPFIASAAIVIGVVAILSAVPLKMRCTAGVGALAGRTAGTAPVYNTIRTCGAFVALQSAYE